MVTWRFFLSLFQEDEFCFRQDSQGGVTRTFFLVSQWRIILEVLVLRQGRKNGQKITGRKERRGEENVF